MIKWPPDNVIFEMNHFDEAKKSLTRFMRMNNFKIEEMIYIFTMLNSFYVLNSAKYKLDINKENSYDNDTPKDQEAARSTQESERE